MLLHLIRHTSLNIAPGICYGQTDLDVADSFPEEADRVNQKLRELKLTNDTPIYSSPLQRCIKLSQTIQPAPITTDDRLMEMNFGDWEMQAWNDIDETALRQWTDNYITTPCPQGESCELFHKRVGDFLTQLKNQDHTAALIVTHGGVIRSIMCHLGQTTLEKCFEVKVDYGDVFTFEM